MVDDGELEQRLFEWWRDSLERFLASHPGEVYFGLAVTSNPFDPGFFLSVGCEAPRFATLRSTPSTTPEDLREHPECWAYESIDVDRETFDVFEERFGAVLAGFLDELMSGDGERMRGAFERLLGAQMRALRRVEVELVEGSSRFHQPADVFVHFEDDELDRARERYRALREGRGPPPGWSREIRSLG